MKGMTGSNHPFVRWSSYTDTKGRPMVDIGGCHYTQPLARLIAQQINELVTPPADPTDPTVPESDDPGKRSG